MTFSNFAETGLNKKENDLSYNAGTDTADIEFRPRDFRDARHWQRYRHGRRSCWGLFLSFGPEWQREERQ
jgi:hypothetical protein